MGIPVQNADPVSDGNAQGFEGAGKLVHPPESIQIRITEHALRTLTGNFLSGKIPDPVTGNIHDIELVIILGCGGKSFDWFHAWLLCDEGCGDLSSIYRK